MVEQSSPVTDVQQAVPVAQIDRDNYADFGRMIARLTRRDADNVRAGEWDYTKDVQFFAQMRARLTPIGASDMVLVPREPTQAMIQAVWKATLGGSLLSAERAARAMLAAAPVPELNICPKCEGREDSAKWLERWYGSEPQKGSAIVDERGNLIAHFGGDETTHKATTAAVSAHNAAFSTPSPAIPEGKSGDGVGWIVTSGDGLRFRCWRDGSPNWTTNRDVAVRYARREDAESVHAEDDDAWRVEQFAEIAKNSPAALTPDPIHTREAELFRKAANLVYRIEAAGPIDDERANIERWKADARALAPGLRAALNTRGGA